MHGSTITHQVIGVHSASRVLLKPASPGTGVIAGGGVRAVLELAGIHDVLSKSLGSQNPINLVKATVAALEGLRRPEEVAKLRGLTVREVLGLGDGGEAAAERRSPRSRLSEVAGRRRRRRPPVRGRRLAGDGGIRLPDGTLVITQVRSANGSSRKQRESLKALGLGKIGRSSERDDQPTVRGLIKSVDHLVEVRDG